MSATAAPAPPPARSAPAERRVSRRRVHTPTVLQMEAVECGAAALAMILQYHGKVVPLEELRVQCGVSRDGAKASNVVKAARAHGLDGRGRKVELEDVPGLAVPCILFWNFNHFVVFEGCRGGHYYLNDPAEGPRVLAHQEFDEAFTGVVLAFEPGAEFQRGGQRPSLVDAVRARLAGSSAVLRFVLFTGLLTVVTGLVIPSFSQMFVDKVLVDNRETWYRPVLVAMVVTAVLRAALTALQQYHLSRLQLKVAVTSAARFMWHLLRLPVEFYAQRYSGEISTRVALNDTIATFMGKQLASAAVDALVVGVFLLLMLSYDWVLTLVGLGAAAAVTAVTVRVNRFRADGNRRLVHEEGKASGALISALTTIETMKASGSETDLFQRWAGYHAKGGNARQKFELATQLFLAVPPLLTAITNTAVLGVGAVRVMGGALTPGQLVAFQSLMSSFLVPVNNLVSLASNMQTMDANMGRIDDVLRYAPDPQVLATPEPTGAATGRAGGPARGQARLQTRGEAGGQAGSPGGCLASDAFGLAGYVELRDVTFGYSRLAPPLLKGFTLELTPGRRVALVGPSGCGKSTVAKLVSGLYTPWAGEIRLDGRPRAEYRREVLNNSVAVVDQDIALFEGTIRDNLTLWNDTIPDTVVTRACRDACIHDEIIARPGGYDGPVREAGADLSGGQRQRLEIARALIANPRVLVLDEATSALDAATEQQVDRNLRLRGCACIIVAHRLSTVRDADEIVVLRRGRVVQRGTHDVLMADADGLYAELAREY